MRPDFLLGRMISGRSFSIQSRLPRCGRDMHECRRLHTDQLQRLAHRVNYPKIGASVTREDLKHASHPVHHVLGNDVQHDAIHGEDWPSISQIPNTLSCDRNLGQTGVVDDAVAPP